MFAAYLEAQRHGGTFGMVWTNLGPGIHIATVQRTSAGKYRIVTCNPGHGWWTFPK